MSGSADNVVQTGHADNVVIAPSHDRRGVIALVVVALALVAAVVLVAVNAFDSQIRADQPGGPAATSHEVSANGSSPPSPQVAAVARYGPSCLSGWVAPDKGNVPVPYTDDRPFAEAVLGSDGEVVVTVQGLTGKSVVLQSMAVEVVRRSPPMAGVYLPRKCDGEVTPRKYRTDLDAATPRLTPEPGTVGFPYKVNDVEPEYFVLTPKVTSGDVEWRLRLAWTSGTGSGELVIDDAGKPFRVTTPSAARKFCVHYSESGEMSWRPSC